MDRDFWWPNTRQDVQRYVDDTYSCATRDPQRRPWLPPCSTMPVPVLSHELVCMDLCQLPYTKRGHQYVLVITDVLTRFTCAFPPRNQAAETVAWFFYANYSKTTPSCLDQSGMRIRWPTIPRILPINREFTPDTWRYFTLKETRSWNDLTEWWSISWLESYPDRWLIGSTTHLFCH